MKLIFIHGRGQEKKDVDKLQKEWEGALKKGLQSTGLVLPQGTEVTVSFYGDKLDELVKQVNASLISEAVTRGSVRDPDEAEFKRELLSEIAANNGITTADIRKHYNGEPQGKGPLNWEWVQAILKAFDMTPLGEAAIDAFTRDVSVYLNYSVVRKAVDARVEQVFTDGPCVVVGHSLGTVVGYNVLRKLAATKTVRRYITVGSPLGLNAIKRKLGTPLAMPAGVNSWYNAMDERDVVALQPLDESHFPIKPAIINKTRVNNHTDNRHGIEGYLNDPDVARWIHEALV